MLAQDAGRVGLAATQGAISNGGAVQTGLEHNDEYESVATAGFFLAKVGDTGQFKQVQSCD